MGQHTLETLLGAMARELRMLAETAERIDQHVGEIAAHVDLSLSSPEIQKIDLLRQHLWDISSLLDYLAQSGAGAQQRFDTGTLVDLVRLVSVQKTLLGTAGNIGDSTLHEGDVDFF